MSCGPTPHGPDHTQHISGEWHPRPPSATDAGSAHLTVACVQAPVGEAPAAGLPLGVSFPWDPSGLSLGHCPWPFPSFRSCPERTVCQFVFMERNRSLTGHFFLPGSRPQSTGDRLRGLPVGLHEVEVRLREVLQHCVTSGSPTYCRVLRRLFLPMACFLPRIHLKVIFVIPLRRDWNPGKLIPIHHLQYNPRRE